MDVSMAFSALVAKTKPTAKEYYTELATSFVNVNVSPAKAAEYILAGTPYTVWLRPDESGVTRRRKENYLLGQHLALDFDNGDVTVESLRDDPLAQKYACLAYPTLSSTAEKPRTRLLFVLDQPIHQAENYRRAVVAMMQVYQTADPQCSDPTRFFFGAGEGYGPQAAWFNGKVLPLEKVKTIILAQEAARKPVEIPKERKGPGDGKGLVRFWEEKLASTREGSRNKVLNDAAHALGELVAEGKLNREDAVARLFYAAHMCGLTGHEVEATIQSGFRKWGVA